MSYIMNAESLAITQLRATLRLRDPLQQTICVGGAALAACFAEAGIALGPIDDVDVLCSPDYFKQLMVRAETLQGVSKLQLRWPNDRRLARGGLYKAIDILPDRAAITKGVLPFTACHTMQDDDYAISFDKLLRQPQRLTVACGIRCLKVAEVLQWIATIGRDKDIKHVDYLAPQALSAELLTNKEYQSILALREKSSPTIVR